MQDLLTMLTTMKRPRLLISAARFGTNEYMRDKHLKRLLKTEVVPSTGSAVIKLIDIERDMNDMRKSEDATYSVAKHVEVLIAMMGEARILKMARP